MAQPNLSETKAKVALYQEEKTDATVPAPAPQPEQEAAPATPPTAPRSETEWNDLISHRIEEAMRNGAFDNLRNKGKPLANTRNPFVPEDRQMANDLLKNNGLAPQWINDRTALLQTLEIFRTKFRTTAEAYRQAWGNAETPIVRNGIRDQWTKQVESWQEEIRLLNQRINVINLQQPVASLEIFKLLLDEELKRVGMQRVL